MNWVILSLGMMLVVAANGLIGRKLLVKGVSGALINFINFFGCFVFYSLFLILSGGQFFLSFVQFLAILLMSVLFDYLGNVFYMQSIARAPNPGYGLVVMKSSVMITTLLAFLFFNSEISAKSILAIAMVLFSVAVIFLSDSKNFKKETAQNWILPSLGALFCFSFFSLAMKYVLAQGVDSKVVLVYVSLILAGMFYFDVKKDGKSYSGALSSNLKILLAAGVLLSVAVNWFFAEAIKAAPNPGYVGAFDAASSALVVLAAARLFKDHLSPGKLAGVLGVIAGLMVLLL